MSNILPQKQISKIARLYRKRFMVVVFTSVTILFLVSCVLIAPSLYFAKQNEIALTAKKAQLDQLETGSYRTSLTASIADINDRLQVFGPTPAASPVIGSFVNIVLAAKTPAVHIDEMHSILDEKNSNAADITVKGTADSREALLYFADTLRGYSSVSNLDVPIDTFIKNTDVPFTLTATVALN